VSSQSWIDRQLRRRGIDDERVLAAMAAVPRERFVPVEARARAYDDAALSLSHGQTISQPYMVALTCQLLALHGDELVLDVGTGSGYAAAVLAQLAAEVISIERIPALAERARATLAAVGVDVEVRIGDGSLGAPDRAPFGGIAVAAAAQEVPQALWQQLAPGRRLVLPLDVEGGQRLLALERSPKGPLLRGSVPARFVPLVVG
jgi:protein-L-isoaspartate(D-aspartate) O-methyltransferase